jgi:hypothetical protein
MAQELSPAGREAIRGIYASFFHGGFNGTVIGLPN